MSHSSTSNSERAPDGLIVIDEQESARGLAGVTAWFVIGVFVFSIVGTLAADHFFRLPAPALAGEEKQQEEKRREEARVLDGSMAKLIERDLRIRSRVRAWINPPYSRFL